MAVIIVLLIAIVAACCIMPELILIIPMGIWQILELVAGMVVMAIIRIFLLINYLVDWASKRDKRVLSTLGGVALLGLIALAAAIFS